jgi:hypothetical protein
MRIAPEIVRRHWEAAAAEQLAKDLERKGYKVSQHERIGDHVADVVARRGDEVTVYEVKAPPWDERQADEFVELRDWAVRSLNARFKLIIVTPPHEVAAEIAGLDRILLDRLNNPLPEELDLLSSCTEVDDVSDLEIGSIVVKPPEIHVEGNAIAHVTLQWGRGDDAAEDRESFPFTFALNLDTQGRLLNVEELAVDTSAWYGDDEEDGATESPASVENSGTDDDLPF